MDKAVIHSIQPQLPDVGSSSQKHGSSIIHGQSVEIIVSLSTFLV